MLPECNSAVPPRELFVASNASFAGRLFSVVSWSGSLIAAVLRARYRYRIPCGRASLRTGHTKRPSRIYDVEKPHGIRLGRFKTTGQDDYHGNELSTPSARPAPASPGLACWVHVRKARRKVPRSRLLIKHPHNQRTTNPDQTSCESSTLSSRGSLCQAKKGRSITFNTALALGETSKFSSIQHPSTNNPPSHASPYKRISSSDTADGVRTPRSVNKSVMYSADV